MKFLIILNSNIKRMLKNKKNIIGTFLVPAIVMLVFSFILNKIDSTDNKYYVIQSDKGIYSQEFINEMKKSTNIKIYEKTDGIERLKSKKISICYEIPENFSELIAKGEKPNIISYNIDKGMEPKSFQFNANSIINKMILRNEFKAVKKDISLEALSYEGTHINVIGKDKKGIGDVVILNMIISFALFSAIGIAMELFELKKQNIFKRSFTTSNKPQTIIGGVLVALFILSSLTYITIFLLCSFVYSSSNLNNAPIIVLNIIFMVLLALSLGVFITRLIKNENLLNVVLQIVISLTCFIGGSYMPIEFLPKSISAFSKFTPQYWALQSINTGNVWLSFVVVLFSLVLFTAGTFKAKNFME